MKKKEKEQSKKASGLFFQTSLFGHKMQNVSITSKHEKWYPVHQKDMQNS